MRRPLATLLVLVILLAWVPAGVSAGPAPVRQTGGPPDPANDTMGWEGGYWYNESLAVTNEDGLNETELERVVARAMARVEFIREVEFEERVPVAVITRSEYTEQYGSAGNHSAALRHFDNAKMEALFLIGEDEDSLSVQRANRNTSVLGFYTPEDDRIVVISGTETAQMAELTLAHELVHAYQDQAYNLSALQARTRDGVNARNGVVEGDANYVEHRYSNRCGEEWDCVQPPGDGSGGGELANLGVYLMKFQPYSDGPAFVESVYQRGGWSAVDALYADLPASAEQIIHPDKYGSDDPTNVTLRDRNADNWTRVRPPDRPDYATVGEAALTSMLVYPLYDSQGRTQIIAAEEWLNETDDGLSSFDPLNYANRYATGWDGDRMHVYRNADNETAYVWRLVWDSEGEAAEFVDGYEQVLSYWGGEQVGPNTYRIEAGGFADAFFVTVEGDTVTIVNAPTVPDLRGVRQGVDPQTTTPTPSPTPTATPPPTDRSTGTAPGSSPADGGRPEGVPGFGPVAAAVALLSAALLAVRRGRC